MFEISIAPLRERREDVLSLVEHFIDELGPGILDAAPGRLTAAAREKLQAYPWPGNVRELRNTVERALILCDGGPIDVEHLPDVLDPTNLAPRPCEPVGTQAPTTVSDLEIIERRIIEETLQQTGQNKAKAARILGVTRKRLYTRIHRLGLEALNEVLPLNQ